MVGLSGGRLEGYGVEDVPLVGNCQMIQIVMENQIEIHLNKIGNHNQFSAIESGHPTT